MQSWEGSQCPIAANFWSCPCSCQTSLVWCLPEVSTTSSMSGTTTLYTTWPGLPPTQWRSGFSYWVWLNCAGTRTHPPSCQAWPFTQVIVCYLAVSSSTQPEGDFAVSAYGNYPFLQLWYDYLHIHGKRWEETRQTRGLNTKLYFPMAILVVIILIYQKMKHHCVLWSENQEGCELWLSCNGNTWDAYQWPSIWEIMQNDMQDRY